MNNNTQRIEYIDLAKFIGIFLMVLCHAGMHNMATSVIYAFHMPLFFFLSGYLFDRNKTSTTFGSIMRKKAFSILVPYYLFSLILCFGTRGIYDWGLLLYASRDALAVAADNTALWFLPCFFISIIVFYFVVKITRRSNILYGISIIAIACAGFVLAYYRSSLPLGYPFNLDVALVCVLIMAAGNCCKKLDIKTWMGGGILFVGTALSQINLPQSLTEGNPHVEISISSYGNPFLFLVVSILLSESVVILCKAMSLHNVLPKSILKIMAFYGANTITILCLHVVFLVVLGGAIKIIGINMYGIEPLLKTIICFIFMYPIILFINSKLPNIIGRRI